MCIYNIIFGVFYSLIDYNNKYILKHYTYFLQISFNEDSFLTNFCISHILLNIFLFSLIKTLSLDKVFSIVLNKIYYFLNILNINLF